MREIHTQLPPVHAGNTLPSGIVKVSPSSFDRHIRVQDPYDISSAAHYALSHILQDQKRAHEEGRRHVVLMGEEHVKSSHRSLQAVVITLWDEFSLNNSEAGGFIIGDETSHMLLQNMGCDGHDHVLRAQLTALNVLKDSHAPLASSLVLQAIAARQIPYFHVDADECDEDSFDAYLNAEDTHAQKAYADVMHGMRLDDYSVPAQDALGMAVRNRVHFNLVDEILVKAPQTSALLMNGGDHITGHEEDKILYSESLTALFQNAVYLVTPIIPDFDDLDADPSYFSEQTNRSQTIAIDGLSAETFDYQVHDKGLQDEKQHLKFMQQHFMQANQGTRPYTLPSKLRSQNYYAHIWADLRDCAANMPRQELLTFVHDALQGQANVNDLQKFMPT